MRLILCLQCAAKPHYQDQHPEDKAMGFRWRRVEIPRVQKPSQHHIVINGKRQPELETLLCYGCSVSIPDGSRAVAITQWRGGEMGPWEKEYQL